MADIKGNTLVVQQGMNNPRAYFARVQDAGGTYVPSGSYESAYKTLAGKHSFQTVILHSAIMEPGDALKILRETIDNKQRVA